MTIVTLTLNPTIDSSTSVERVEADKKLRCAKPRHEPGGGGINVARVINRLGSEVRAVFTAGGPDGRLLSTLLEEEGVSTEAVEIEDFTRNNLTVTENSSDRQFRFVMPGPDISDNERENLIECLKRHCRDADYFVLSGSLPGNTPDRFYADLAARVKECDTRVIADTVGQPLRDLLDEGIFLFKPNLRELSELANDRIKSNGQVVAICRNLIEKGATKAILVSLGANGAVLVTEEKAVHYRTPTVDIKSKVGAGDSMVAGLVVALSQGNDFPDAARLGVAAGAAAVTTAGSELCRPEDVKRLAAQVTRHPVSDQSTEPAKQTRTS